MNVEHNQLVNSKTGLPIPLAMQRLELSGYVTPLGAYLRITHKFRCGGTEPMEALYVSILPRDGAVRRFTVKGDGFSVESKLERREEARKTYEAGIDAGSLSVLGEAGPDGLFTISVGQVRPGEDVTVVVDAVAGLSRSDDGFRFRFPFTLAPSYHASAKMASTPDGPSMELPESVFGDVILPAWKTDASGLHEISFSLDVFGVDANSISSPSHHIAVKKLPNGDSKVTLATTGAIPNSDLVLDVGHPDATVLLADGPWGEPVMKDIPEDAPLWAAFIPSSIFREQSQGPRKVTFVLDRSESMAGIPMAAAKTGLKACLSALTPNDHFNMVHFGTDAKAFSSKPYPATEVNRREAAKWIDDIQCSGGTELAQALAEAVRVSWDDMDIVLITDGQVWDTEKIIRSMKEAGTRVSIIGIGSASQDRFLARLASETGGVQEMLHPREDIAMAALRLFNAVGTPPKGRVHFGEDIHDIAIVPGKPAMLAGRCQPPTTMAVEGFPQQPFVVSSLLPQGLVALLSAARKLAAMDAAWDDASASARTKLERDMIALSNEYGIACKAMSLVAVVDRAGDEQFKGITPKQRVIPVGYPECMATNTVFCSTQSLNYNSTRGIQPRKSGVVSSMEYAGSCVLYENGPLSNHHMVECCETSGMGISNGMGAHGLAPVTVPDYSESIWALSSTFGEAFASHDVDDGLQPLSCNLPTSLKEIHHVGVPSFMEGPDGRLVNPIDVLANLKDDGSFNDDGLRTLLLYLLILREEYMGRRGAFKAHLKRMHAYMAQLKEFFASRGYAGDDKINLCDKVANMAQPPKGDNPLVGWGAILYNDEALIKKIEAYLA